MERKIESVYKIGYKIEDAIKGRFSLNLSSNFKVLLSVFSFRILIFSSLLMQCERLNCAQCLTVMALKNDARGVDQFVATSPTPNHSIFMLLSHQAPSPAL